MKRCSSDCDMCGAKDIDPIEVSLVVDRTMDAAGGMSNDVESLDICKTCAPKFIGIMKSTVKITHNEAAIITEKVRSAKMSKVSPR